MRERELIEHLFERSQAAEQVPDHLVRLCRVIERARGVREGAQCVTCFLAIDDRILECRHFVSPYNRSRQSGARGVPARHTARHRGSAATVNACAC